MRRSLVPIAMGHALAIGSLVLAAAVLGMVLPLATVRGAVAAVLIGLGVFRMMRHRHPRWVRMQVGFCDLAAWSFLMASAHGAGLMVLPVLLGTSGIEASGVMAGHAHGAEAANAVAALLATIVHSAGYLAVTGGVAWVVYRKVGLALLRTAWFNIDLAWAAALIIAGVVTVWL